MHKLWLTEVDSLKNTNGHKAERLRISISFFGVLMLLALLLTHSYLSLAALLAATLHELGHIAAAKLLRVGLCEMRLGIFGASLSTDSPLSSYRSERILALSGPSINLVCAALGGALRVQNEFFEYFISASLFLALFNLAPISDFDGGRVLYSLIAEHLTPNAAARVMSVLSFAILFSLWCLSVYLMLRLGASLSLFVFSSALFCKIFIGRSSEEYQV